MDTNSVSIFGHMADTPSFSHRYGEEAFFSGKLAVFRRSGVADILPLLFPERLCFVPSAGDQLFIEGQLRSYSPVLEGKRRLRLHLFVRSAEVLSEGPVTEENSVSLSGRLLKPPVYRVSPLGREITDLLLGTERGFGKLERIPLILWEKEARRAAELKRGDRIRILGRFQSRDYEKCLPDGSRQRRTAYEVSCSGFEPFPT